MDAAVHVLIISAFIVGLASLRALQTIAKYTKYAYQELVGHREVISQILYSLDKK